MNSIPPDYVLAPGERIVQDELQSGPLVVVVSERVTTDQKDHGSEVRR